MATIGLALVPHAHLTHPRLLGKGAFGDVDLAEYVERGLTVAVKCNGTTCVDEAAIDNERRLYDKLLLHPHENILTVYGICIDAPDGKVRLVMRYCEKGSLDDYLTGTCRRYGCVFMIGLWLPSVAVANRGPVVRGSAPGTLLSLLQTQCLLCAKMLCRAA
jgi:hypothetical protein